MKKNSVYFILFSLSLSSCNPFTIANRWGQGGATTFGVIGIVLLILIVIELFSYFKAIISNTGKARKKFELKSFVTMSLLATFFLLNGINSANNLQKFDFCKDHVGNYIYKTENELKSEYKQVGVLNLASKKVMVVKTSHGDYGRVMSDFEKFETSVEDIMKKTGKGREEAEKEAYQLNFEFDTDLYRKLPNEFQVADGKDFKSVGIIIQKDYSAEIVGKYTSGSNALRAKCNLLIYDIFEKSYIEVRRFTGSDPPESYRVGPLGSSYDGSKISEKEFLNYIVEVIKKQ